MTHPLTSYRLQIREAFTLDHAAEIVDYLDDLGVDWLYLSPLLTAEPGSDHGYDVVDHRAVDPARGGPDALDRLAARAHAAGRRLLVDIVPNHVGVASPVVNRWWWDVLAHGRASRYADAFDIDWDAGGGKLRIPVLGDDDELDRLERVGDELKYYDNRFPIAPGTGDDGATPRDIHSRQSYELIGWRRADTDLNYRRFFAVNSLAAIRVEEPWVFTESHAEITRWVREGLVHGLRVDHPDGLADPGGYLDALRSATGVDYVLVEKILQGGESLPSPWACEGTTGYDVLGDVDRILTDPRGAAVLDDYAARVAASPDDVIWSTQVTNGKRDVATRLLRSEVRRLARDAGRDGDIRAEEALIELLAAFPVYRSYLPLGSENLRAAARSAAAARPDLADTIAELREILGDRTHPAAVRFQQTSGMVMAKGVEDGAFYRFSRLSSLNEVGGEPDEFSLHIEEFHGRQQKRLASYPTSLTTLSTHDTKRGEDVRARIDALSEISEDWTAALDELHALHPLAERAFERLLWEAIVGSWPASVERLEAYALKAAREGGRLTTWTDPDPDAESSLADLVRATRDNDAVRSIVERIVASVRDAGWSNSLSAKLIQFTLPGVPDVYQGSELWETSLVDPDNRRRVDFDERRRILADIVAGARPAIDESGAAKLLVTRAGLRARRDHPEWFTRYFPVPAFGNASAHVIAFDRGQAITVATRLPVGLQRAGGWQDTTLEVPGRGFIDALTGREFTGPTIAVADLLAEYPVALLIPCAETTSGDTTTTDTTTGER